nr:ISAs1 family transposase [Streptomyces fulvoviolaceus]
MRGDSRRPFLDGNWTVGTLGTAYALARLGARTVGALAVRTAPSPATIRRVIGAVCPGGLADLTGADPAGAASVAVDGKTARGSRHREVPAVHLLAAMTGDGRTVTQLPVPGKTNEITCFAALLAPFDLAGVTVTADALHTQQAHVRFLVEDKKAHFLLLVKANQPELFAALRALPWKEVTARRYDREAGHGRRETRATRVLTVTGLGLDFPHVVQAARILRYRVDVTSGKCTRETVYAITDLASAEASPQKIARLARSMGSPLPEELGEGRSRTGSTTSGTPPSPRTLEDPYRARVGQHGHPPQPRDQRPSRGGPPQHRRRTPRSLLRTLYPPVPGHQLTSTTARSERL